MNNILPCAFVYSTKPGKLADGNAEIEPHCAATHTVKKLTQLCMFVIMAMLPVIANSQSTIVSAISGNWTDGTTWVGGMAPGPADNVVISPLTTVTLSGVGPGFTINGLNIMTGGVLNAENKVLTINGNLVVDGTYTTKNPSSRDLEFYGSSISGSGSIKIDYVNMSVNIHSNAVVEPSSQLIIYGNLRIFNNITLTNRGRIEITRDITGGSNSVWNNSDNSVLIIGNTLLSTGQLNASSPGNTIEYNGQANQNIKSPLSVYNNLVIRGAGNKNLLAGLIIEGNLDIRSTAVLASNNYSLELRRNWTNNSDFNQGTGEVIFSSNRIQILSGLNDEIFYRLKIDKTGGEVLLNTNIVVSNMLTMTRGIINSSAYKTTVGTGTSSVGTLTWLSGFVKGKYEKWVNNTGTIRFPVGYSSVQYILLDLAAFSSGGSMVAEFIPDDPGNNGLSLTDGTATIRNTFVEGYWNLSPSNGFSMSGTDNYNLRLLGTGFTSFPLGAETRILTRADQSSLWTAMGIHIAGTAHIASRGNVNVIPAQFALADGSLCTRPVTSAITGPVEVCTGDSPVIYSVMNSGNTFNWSVTGGTILSGNGTNTINVAWGAEGNGDAGVSVYEISCTRGVTVNLPVTLHTAGPASISGARNVPENTLGSVYSVTERPGYIYQWNISGGTQVSGGSTGSITVDWGPAGMGSVSVIAEYPGCSLAPEVTLDVRKYDVIESVRSGDWDMESTWDCNCVPLQTQSVRIRNGHTVQLTPDADQSINNMIIDIGGIFDHNDYTFRVSGDFVVNGTYSGSNTAPLTLDGTDMLIDGIGSVIGGFSVTGSKSISPTAILGISGDINLGSSVFINNQGMIALEGSLISPDASSTWMNSGNSVLEIGGSLLLNGTLRASADGNRVTYTGAAQVIKTPFNSVYHDLIVAGTETKTLSGSLVIDGDFSLEGSTLDVTNVNYQIALKGDWINTGGIFTARQGTVTFNGEREQNVTGAEQFFNLTYTNDLGNLILSNDVTARGVLTMSGRDIITGTNVLKLGSDAANTGSLVYESGIVIGKLERWIGPVGPYLFPVGVSGSYNPATITINTITSGSLIGEYIPVDPGFVGLPLRDIDTDILYQFSDGYWNFVPQNSLTPPSYSVSLHTGNFHSHTININTRILKRTSGGPWMLDGSHRNAEVSTVYRDLLTGGLSATGTQFGVGFVCQAVDIVSLITHVSCNGGSNAAIDISVSGGLAPYTYSWTPGSQTTQDISGLTAGLYGVSVTDAEQCLTPAIFSVFEPLQLDLTEEVTDVTCGIPDNGAINITVHGGTAPYIYGWTTSNGSGLDFDSEDQTGLTAGTYRVLVLDMSGCSITKDIVVSAGAGPPAAPSASVTIQPDCSISTGTIEVTSPLGEYEYSIDGISFQAGFVFENLAPGNYNVTVRSTIDISCISQPTLLTINPVPVPPAAPVAEVTSQPTCGVPTGNIQVTSPLGAEWEYSLDAGVFQFLPEFSALAPGSHSLTLRNSLESTCISAPAIVMIDPVPPPPPVPAVQNVVQTTCGSPTGSIEFVSQPGVQYSIGSGYQAGTLFPNLVPGTYSLSVRSIADNTCITFGLPVTINPEPSAPDVPAALITVQPTCGVTFATLTITEPLGAQYEYNIDGGPYQASPILTDVPPGNHILTTRLIASPTCVSAPSVPVVVNPPEMPAVPSATVTEQPNCTVPTGTITFTVQAGVEYSVGSGYQASPVFAGLTPGLYTISVRRTTDHDCITFAVSQLTVSPVPVPPAAPVAVVSVQPTCGDPSATATVTSPLGAEWEYSLNGGTFQSSPLFTGVSPGNHSITVRSTLQPTCISGPANIVVNAVPAPPAVPVVETVVQPVCGTPTGSIQFTVQAGVQYSAGAGYQAGTLFTGLVPGTYTISVRSIADNSCITFGTPVTIDTEPSAPDAPAAIVTVQPTCGFLFATLTITEPLGAQYEYNIDGGPYQASPILTNVAPGNHVLTTRVTAMPSCVSAPFNIVVNPPEMPAVPTATVTEQPTCAVPTGTITFTVQGGVEYSVGSGYQAGTVFAGLSPGTYTLSVRRTDDNDCITFAASQLSVSTVPVSPAQPAAAVTTQPSCLVPSGIVTVTSPLGAQYEYSLDGGSYQPGAVFTGVAIGLHTVTARLVSSITCVSIPSAMVQVNPVPEAPVVTYTKTDVVCYGSTAGSIDITVTGGTAPYTYAWTGPGVIAGSQDQTGLAAGTYEITVTDANGCSSVPHTITITQPATALSGSIVSQTNVSVNGGSDGSVSVEGSGGTAPYMYRLDAGAYQASGLFTALAAGTYSVTVRDAAMCTAIVTVVITEPDPLSGTISNQQNIECFGQTGSVTVTGTGGLVPYEYRLNSGVWQASGTFGSLPAGDFVVTVRDASLVTFDVPVTIYSPDEAVGGSIVSQTDALCAGTSTGSVTVTATGGVPPYMYSLNGGAFQSGTSFSVSAGTHVVTIRDDKLCTYDISVTVSEPASALTGNITNTTGVRCHGASDGAVTSLGSGGTGTIEYSLDGGAFQESGTFEGLDGGNHSITIRDANLCTISLQFTIAEPAALAVAEVHTNTECPGDPGGSVSLTVTGGTGPYNVLWSDGATGDQRTGLTEGEYSAVITDFYSCAAPIVVTVGVDGSEACLMIPEIITPNGDGHNDTWKIKNIDLFPDAEVVIFNRAGKRVFRQKNLLANPWDGRLNGKLLPTDSYHYILDLHDGSKPRTGVISIIR